MAADAISSEKTAPRISAESATKASAVVGRAVIAFSVALATLALAETLVHAGSFDLTGLVLGGITGAVIGMLVGSLELLVHGRALGVRIAFWSALGITAGLIVAIRLNAFAKFSSPYRELAFGVIAAAIIGGGLLGCALAFTQAATLPAFLQRPAGRLALVTLAGAIAVGSEIADQTLLVLRSYPIARTALVWGSWVIVGTAAISLLRAFPADWPTPRMALIAKTAWFAALALGVGFTAGLSAEQARRLFDRPNAGKLLELARAATDFDRDGASAWFAGGDCAPWQASVHPRATEVPGNGIDDNCFWGDAPKLPGATTFSISASEPSPVNVVLVTIDTLRADHMGAYGYNRSTTPNLDLFSGTALRFEHAYTAGGWTCLSVHSLLAGVYARRLTWEPIAVTEKKQFIGFPWDGRIERGDSFSKALSVLQQSPFPPLAVLLRRRGMRTGAVLGGKVIAELFRHRRWVEETFEPASVRTVELDDEVTDAALEIIDGFGSDPFFLWVHYFGPHDPYAEHPDTPRFGNGVEDRYDHDVAFTDGQVGRLLARVPDSERPSATIITADHGEGFHSEVPVHGIDLREEVIRVPLMIRAPGVTTGVERAPTSLVDIAPTVLELTKTPRPPWLDGVSLLAPPPNDRVVITDLWHPDRDGRMRIDMVGATSSTRRLVHNRLQQTWVAFDLSRRPQTPELRQHAGSPELLKAIGTYLDQATGSR